MLLITLKIDLPKTRPYIGGFQLDMACWNAIEAFYVVGGTLCGPLGWKNVQSG